MNTTRIMRLGRFYGILVLAAAAFGGARDVVAQAGTQPGEASRANKEGDYGGVTPGDEGEDANQANQRRKPAKNRATWIGFQPRSDGAARLFVQLTSEASYTQEVTDGVLSVKLDGIRFANRNARRRLDMRFFDTALRQVTSRYVRKRRARGNRPAQTAGVELRVEFKNPSEARKGLAELVADKDGYYYLFLAFDEPLGNSGDGDGDGDGDRE